MKDQTILKFMLQETNKYKVEDFLFRNKTLDPRKFTYLNNNNILHNLSYDGKKDMLELYLIHTYNYIWNNQQQSPNQSVKQQLAAWINLKNQQGFTPLLYAAFNGHVNVVQYLISKGANYQAKNNTQLNILHMAAQNNKVSILIYFRQMLDFNQPDGNGITPLHWASCNGSEQAVAFLLTVNNIKINLKDNQGQTPLVLATSYGNTKIVRRLLMKGADRNIKNMEGKTALQIAQQNQFENIKKMLYDKYQCCDFLKFYYNVKVQYRKKSRSYQIPIVFTISTLCSILILNGLLIFNQNYLYIIEACVIGLMFLLYLSLIIPPNKLPKGQLNAYDCDKLCFQCLQNKTKRSYHCDICDTCINQYDHHCTWINNCVGKNNIGRFILFIFLLLLSLFIIGSTAIWGILKLSAIKDLSQKLFSIRIQSSQQWQKWAKIILFSINTFMSLFFIPVCLLFIVQVKNLLTNKTTYQSVRGQASELSSKRTSKGPSIKNCITMCTNNKQSFLSEKYDDQLLSH